MDGKHGWYSGRCRPPAINDVQELKDSFGGKEATAPWSDLWTGGLVCAFEFVRRRGHGFVSPHDFSRSNSSKSKDFPVITDSGSSTDGDEPRPACRHGRAAPAESYWSPIGWARITELVAMVDGDDTAWHDGQGISSLTDADADGRHCCGDSDITVADVAVPYWQRPAGPTWWCHVAAGHPAVDVWLATSARWLHPAICVALRNETMIISEKMKHLLYEVPVRVSGGLLFELLGQSVGDPTRDEDDIPVVIRAWQAQNFLITALHVKGSAPNVNVIGVTEVQDIKKDARKMIEEQEAVRGRLFTIQDVMQSTVRAWLQDKSLRITHNLTIFGLLLIVAGNIYFGLKNPINDQQVQVRKLELQQLVSMFQHDAETHAKVREGVLIRNDLPPRAADLIYDQAKERADAAAWWHHAHL